MPIPERSDRERGALLVEYALLIALIAVLCIAAVSLLNSNAKDKNPSSYKTVRVGPTQEIVTQYRGKTLHCTDIYPTHVGGIVCDYTRFYAENRELLPKSG